MEKIKIMTYQYKFTVVIPHKNRQQLLKRCLDSIPRREDVQIIVVDDNSDPKKVDFQNFPGLHEKNTEVYFTKAAKGAGYARNVGLDHAKGEWIFFADSDDWYLENLESEMDHYARSNADMIVFRQQRKDVDGNDIDSFYDILFDETAKTGNLEKLKYQYACVYGRFIKKQMIEKYHIRFQEVRYSNDVLFSLKVSYFSKDIQFVNKPLYCVCESPNSLMRNANRKNSYIRTKVGLKAFSFVRSKGIIPQGTNSEQYWFYWKIWWEKTKEENKHAALLLIPRIYLTVGNSFLKYLMRNSLIKILKFRKL